MILKKIREFFTIFSDFSVSLKLCMYTRLKCVRRPLEGLYLRGWLRTRARGLYTIFYSSAPICLGLPHFHSGISFGSFMTSERIFVSVVQVLISFTINQENACRWRLTFIFINVLLHNYCILCHLTYRIGWIFGQR